ncbi:MAG: hypothetical protein ISS71_07955 [Phycisphaerae bacterium]|nr:hypothetical protein [Phycisphaerae bacterium]
MNERKKKDIIDFVCAKGKLPTDPYGEILSPDELLVWFGLNECLTPAEQYIIRGELVAMVEIEDAINKIKTSKALRGGD